MTTPAIPQVAPVGPESQAENTDINALMSSITADAIATVTAVPATPLEQPRGPNGRWIKADGTEAAEGEIEPGKAPQVPATTPATPAAPEGAEPEPVALPEGVVLAPPVTGRELATQFTLSDAEGELAVPDLTITFMANGKERKEPLDKVVRLAQFGVYNEERHQQNVQVQRNADEVKQQNTQLLSLLQQAQADREQLLTDDQAYLQARARHEQQNTPEARAEAARQELQFTQAAIQGQTFFASNIAPAVQQIAQTLTTVTEDEIGQRLLLLSDRFRVQTPFGSIINPAAFPQIEQIILSDVVPWAAQLHNERDGQRQQTPPANGNGKAPAKAVPSTPPTPAAPAESARVQALQVEAQKAKNLVGRATRPSKTPGTPQTRETHKPAPITNLQDAEQAALDETFAAMGLSRPRGS